MPDERMSGASSNGTSTAAPMPMEKEGDYWLDCYPHTFSPLLLFSQEDYFDKGLSNYNSVAQFFSPILDVDMLDNVHGRPQTCTAARPSAARRLAAPV